MAANDPDAALLAWLRAEHGHMYWVVRDSDSWRVTRRVGWWEPL